MNTKLKIDRAKLAETFAEIRARPDLPEKAAPGLDFWLKDNAKEIHTQPEAELDKAIKSIESILADTKAPKHLPVIKNAPLPKLTYGAGKGAYGQVELRIDHDKIRAAIDNPKHVPKNDALWVIASGLPSRAKDATDQPVKSMLIMLDFDKMKGRQLQDVQNALYAVAGMPVQHDIYTTYSATKADPRCRLVLPLSNLLESENAYRGAVQWLIEELMAQGIECDPLLDTKRLSYLPNHAEGAFYGTLSNREGARLTTSQSYRVIASRTSLDPTHDPLESILTEQQLADARTVIESMRAKGLHLSGKGHNLWHRVAAALCIYGTIGEQLFCEFSKGDAEYSEQKCIAKLREKARARVDSGIGALFRIAAEHGIENPANGRKPTSTVTGVAQLATMTTGEHKDAGTNLVANLFSKLTLSKEAAAAMVEAKFWVPDMVVRGHITSYPAPANGGKTTLFIHLCEQMAKEGASVFYINVDSPPDKLKQQHAHAEKHGYMAALSDESIADQALQLALFAGGQRMAQLLRAKVSDYDQETETLRLWDKKGKRITPREHLLPLAPKGAAIVEKLLAMAKEESDLLFSSNGSTPMVETTPGKRVFSICQAMGCEAFDLRDIRRTCETMLAGMGVSKDVRAQLLSHGLSGVQAAHYDRYEYITEKRNALDAWERRLDDIAKGKSSDSNVLPMKRNRPHA